MKTPQEVYEEIIASHQELERVPADYHLFCPRLSDDDAEDYDVPDAITDDRSEDPATPATIEEKKQRIQAGRDRLQLTSWASLILGINRDQADRWLPDWIQRTESFLVKCDGCVRAWHMGRKALRSRLLKEFDEETTSIMEGRLHEYDTARIDRGLRRAVEILEKNGPMSSAKLVAIDAPAVLAFYEALCCVEYLSLPENRRLFNYVFQKTQEKRPLKIASAVIPTMTVFLFQPDPLRNTFARTAWQRRPPQSLTPEQFEWAVSDHLADAIEAVSTVEATDAAITLFWDGLMLLLDAMSEDIVLHCLRGMQIPLDVYQLAVQHLDRSSAQVLAHVLRALCALMDKSPKAFWAALSLMNPPQLPMFLCRSPAFPEFLKRSFEDSMQLVVSGTPTTVAATRSSRVPLLVAFVRSLMGSLGRNQRSDVCDYLLTVFVTTGAGGGQGSASADNQLAANVVATREGHSTCVVAGLTALQLTLDGYLDARYRLTAESLLFVNTVINSAVKYHDFVVRACNLHPSDRYNIGLSQAALGVIESSLALDTRALQDEWRSLHQNARVPQGITERRSAALWDGFRMALVPGGLELARANLAATLALRGVQRFPPKKRQAVVDDPSKKRFNNELEPAGDAVGRAIERISEFNRTDLRALCTADSPRSRTMDAIVASLIHAEDSVREAGFLLISAVVDEDTRSESVSKMVYDFSVPFLNSFADSVGSLTAASAPAQSEEYRPGGPSPYEPMRHIYRISRDILDSLCDSSTGMLRSRTLNAEERKAVKRWWTMEWQFIDHSFLRARAWSEDVEKSVMENYCRDVMEFAQQLIAQDGLIASALGGTGGDGGKPDNNTMRDVLDAPQKHSMGLFEMIQLRDLYLVGIIVDILVKLFNRLKEYNLTFPDKFVNSIRKTYTTHPTIRAKYIVNTNLNDTQRAELMKAIGDGGGDEDDDGIEIVSWMSGTGTGSGKTRLVDKKKKQTTIDAWSRGGTSTPSIRSSSPASTVAGTVSSKTSLASILSGSAKDVASSLTPGLNKHRATLDRIKASAASKPDQKALLATRAAIRESRARDKAEMEKHRAEAIAKARALRGAAAPVKSEIMVDSEEEEEEEEDDEEEDDALVLQSKKGEQAMDEAEKRRRRALQLMARGPVKKIKQQRSAKDMRARIIPPMDKLHQAILEWDIFHEGNDPPNGYTCEAVADAYPSPAEYKRTFFPLLIYEAWRSFVTSKNESTARPFGVKVITRISVDNFLEVSTSMPAAANKDRQLGEGDIVLLSKTATPDQDPLHSANARDVPHCLARIWKTTYKRDNLEVAYRLSSRKNQILPVLLPGAEFRAVKITNMTPIEREFAALESLQYYDLMDEVLTAKPSPMLNFGEEAVANMQSNYELNHGQAVAVLNAKANDGFTLVQGPPGTGKTKTIVAMVGALLTGMIKSQAGVAIARPTGGHANGGGGGGDNTSKKLLVCAPSNAAVDELVLRLKQGVKETNGTARKINVLRLGRTDAINAAVKDVTLDELVKAEIQRQTASGEKGKDGAGSATSDRDKMHLRAGEIKTKLAGLTPALEAARCVAAEERDHALMNRLQREHDALRTEQRRIGAQIERDKESGNTYAREAEIKRRQIQQKILSEAHVLCATLSGSGHEMFKNLNVEFETVIIDEAAQCVELSALIPLKYGCAKCVLVGDPKQLPPTVLSQSAARYGYDQSLFVRMQRNQPKDVHLLDTQYRMHPEISLFPSQQFYESRLIDGGDMARLRQQPWHAASEGLLGPYRFFDVEGVQTKGSNGQSLVNENEVRVALQLYKRFRQLVERDASHDDADQEDPLRGKIGIITPYKAQLYRLRSRFAEQYGDSITDVIEFNTTDAFQGRECEVIIFSCVRASPTGGIGFMTDIRRMNVGLTRARSSLWILGDSRALRQGEFWRALIEDAKERKRYTGGGNVLGLLKGPVGGASSGKALAPPPSKPKENREGKGPRGPPVSKATPPKGAPAGPSGRRSSTSNSHHNTAATSSDRNGTGTGNASNLVPLSALSGRGGGRKESGGGGWAGGFGQPTPSAPSPVIVDDDDDAYSPPPAIPPSPAGAVPPLSLSGGPPTGPSGHSRPSGPSGHPRPPTGPKRPPTGPRKHAQPAKPMTTTYTVVDRPSRPLPQGVGSLNERGESVPTGPRGGGPKPVVHHSAPGRPSSSSGPSGTASASAVPKKRPHADSPGDAMPAKRAANNTLPPSGPQRPPLRPPVRPKKKVDPFIKKKNKH